MTLTPKAKAICVAAIILIAAAPEPVLHHWLDGYETETAVATGLHTADSSIYLHTMDMLTNGFHSPFATCNAPNGPNDVAFLPAPFHWLYALVGVVGHGIGADPFLFLGWANAAFGVLYLLSVFRFMNVIAPRYALTAFALFALGGSVGGILYLLGLPLGWQNAPEFDAWFLRLSMYELVEGPYLSGSQHIARLYYTLPLALFFGALTELILSLRIQCPKHLLLTGILLFAAAFVNIRIGGLGWIVMMLYLVSTRELLFRSRINIAIRLTAPVVLAFVAFVGLTALSPTFMRNTGVLVREGLWPTAFIAAALFHLMLFHRPARDGFKQLSPLMQRALLGVAGYLTVYAILFIGYQIYYGTFFQGGDYSASVRLSDFALMGTALALKKPPDTSKEESDLPLGWLVLWAVVFFAIGISAVGQGWMLRLTPQRLLMFIGVPLSLCTAYALHRWHEKAPTPPRIYVAAMLSCGLVSLVTGALYFQGPAGRAPGQGDFANLHPEIMTPDDANLIAQLGPGTVLAPPGVMPDIIALRTDNQVLGGVGSTDLSDVMSTELNPQIAAFFALETVAEDRAAFVEAWCVTWVVCPDTWPVAEEVVAALIDDPHFTLIANSMRGAVFKVTPQ